MEIGQKKVKSSKLVSVSIPKPLRGVPKSLDFDGLDCYGGLAKKYKINSDPIIEKVGVTEGYITSPNVLNAQRQELSSGNDAALLTLPKANYNSCAQEISSLVSDENCQSFKELKYNLIPKQRDSKKFSKNATGVREMLEDDNEDAKTVQLKISMAQANRDYKSHSLKKQKMNNFHNLTLVLKELFLDVKVNNSDLLLTGEEIAILSSLIEKKTGTSLKIMQIYNMNNLGLHNYKLPKRRAEESYKFVFKTAFKHLQHIYAIKHKDFLRNKHPSDFLYYFYTHYFGSLLEKKGLNIACYYLPLTGDIRVLSSDEFIAKTINTGYITLVCESPLFVADLLTYLRKGFLKTYETYASKKIEKIVYVWECRYNKSCTNFKAVEDICEFIVQNKKTKLPWYIREAEDALRVVRDLVLKISSESEKTSTELYNEKNNERQEKLS